MKSTPEAPLIELKDPAGQNRTTPLKGLPNDEKATFVHAAEGRQVSGKHSSVKHVQGFQMKYTCRNVHHLKISTPTQRATRPIPVGNVKCPVNRRLKSQKSATGPTPSLVFLDQLLP